MNPVDDSKIHESHALLSRKIAEEGMVLLRNNGGTLPLAEKQISLFGIGAVLTFKGGTGSGDVHTFHNVSIEEGLKNHGFENRADYYLRESEQRYMEKEVLRKKKIQKEAKHYPLTDWNHLMWVAGKFPSWDDIDRVINEQDFKTCNTDVAVYVISRQAGEGGDRKNIQGDYYLTDTELANIRFLADHYKKSILVLNTAAPVDLSEAVRTNISAIVLYGQAGQEGGNALGALLCGKSNFSGKLSVSWPEHLSDLEISKDYSYLDGNTDKEIYRDGIYVGYRYYNSFGKKALFPFGFGLSYTTFEIRADASLKGNDCLLNVTVRNTGTRAGKEVLECYVSAIGLDTDKEYQSLAAFGKTETIAPGEEAAVTLRFPVADLATYDEENHQFVLKKGTYLVKIGTSSDDTRNVCNLVVKEDAGTAFCQPLVRKGSGTEKLVPTVHGKADDTIPSLILTPDFTPTHPEEKISDTSAAENIPKKDLCRMVVGTMPLQTKGPAGTVGATPVIFRKYGYDLLSMADGPAGLRLSKEYRRLPGGINKGTVLIPEDLQLTKPLYRIINKIATFSFAKLRRQYTTAFPVSLLAAQTFNENLLFEMGKAVKEEMEEFGVDIWLAPALNIIRHPLCGRAFEYYSEDPLLSGSMAGAVAKGVNDGNSKKNVCIKHFCCNSQEENRMKTDSIVSERALEEIYLKGFRITLSTGKVHAVMTSYNKVNGTYVNSNPDFVDGFLRKECGFDGIVMTDWQSVAKGQAVGHEVIASGNDIIMFGGKEISGEIEKNTGTSLSLEQLRKCAARLMRFTKSVK